MARMPKQITTHVDSAAAVGQRVREAREAAGMSQTALSFAGCTTGYISRIERGGRVPSLQVIRELARRLGVSEAWLARGQDEEREDLTAGLREAELALRLGELEEARALYEAAAAGAASAAAQASVAAGLGQIAYRQDDVAGAIETLGRALELDPELWDPSALDVLGRAYVRSGETAAAIALHRRSLTRAEAEHDPAARIRFAVLLAEALFHVGAAAEATTLVSAVLADGDGGDPHELARLHRAQSRLHAEQLEHAAAARHARKALHLLDMAQLVHDRARAHHVLGVAALDAGAPEEALRMLEAGLALLGGDATEWDRAAFRVEMARALAMLGRTDDALALALGAAPEDPSGDAATLGRSYAALADAVEQQGERDRALELYELALGLLRDPPSRYLADICSRYGALLERVGRREDAFEIYKRGTLLQAELERPEGAQA
jgi:tetratricopeptide (TPR) repeat protein